MALVMFGCMAVDLSFNIGSLVEAKKYQKAVEEYQKKYLEYTNLLTTVNNNIQLYWNTHRRVLRFVPLLNNLQQLSTKEGFELALKNEVRNIIMSAIELGFVAVSFGVLFFKQVQSWYRARNVKMGEGEVPLIKAEEIAKGKNEPEKDVEVGGPKAKESSKGLKGDYALAGVFVVMTVMNVIQSSMNIADMVDKEAGIKQATKELTTQIDSLNASGASVNSYLNQLRIVVIKLGDLYALDLGSKNLSLDAMTALLDNTSSSQSTLVSDGLTFYEESFSGYFFHYMKTEFWNNEQVKKQLKDDGYLLATPDEKDKNILIYTTVESQRTKFHDEFLKWGPYFVNREKGDKFLTSLLTYIGAYKTQKIGDSTYFEVAKRALSEKNGKEVDDKVVNRWIISSFSDLILDGITITDFQGNKLLRKNPPEDISVDI